MLFIKHLRNFHCRKGVCVLNREEEHWLFSAVVTLFPGREWPTVLSCLDNVGITQSLLSFTKAVLCFQSGALDKKLVLCFNPGYSTLLEEVCVVVGRYMDWSRRMDMNRSNCDHQCTGRQVWREEVGLSWVCSWWGFFEDTDSSCFESTDGCWDVGICRKARFEGCLSHFFKWAVSSGFSVFKHAFRKVLKECGWVFRVSGLSTVQT